MKRPPFKMLPSRNGAVLRRDGKFVKAGRASFVWETFLMSRAAGVPGVYEVRLNAGPWHRLTWTIEEAEERLAAESKMFGKNKIDRCRRTRDARARRGLEVA